MNYILFLQAFQAKYKGLADKALLFHFLREELQCLILKILYQEHSFPIYFMGGTQLRLSYGINRFSEDIDLALKAPDQKFPSNEFFSSIVSGFSEKVTGFRMHGNLSTKRNVVKIMLSFANILFDIGFTPLQSQTIKIKIELDINPPAYATYDTKIYRSLFGDYMVNTHDLSTGFAGKLATILQREYQKGRDYYDLQWYLTQKQFPHINMDYLNANFTQQGQIKFQNQNELFQAIIQKVEHVQLDLLKQDLERFVLMDLLSFETWLKKYTSETISLLKAYQIQL